MCVTTSYFVDVFHLVSLLSSNNKKKTTKNWTKKERSEQNDSFTFIFTANRKIKWIKWNKIRNNNELHRNGINFRPVNQFVSQKKIKWNSLRDNQKTHAKLKAFSLLRPIRPNTIHMQCMYVDFFSIFFHYIITEIQSTLSYTHTIRHIAVFYCLCVL